MPRIKKASGKKNEFLKYITPLNSKHLLDWFLEHDTLHVFSMGMGTMLG